MDDSKQEKRKEEYIFGLDIGASKLNLFVGISEGENVRVVECGDFPLKNADEFDSVVDTIQQAVQVIENSTRVDVRDVYVGIAGKHVRSYSFQGIVTLPTGEVREEDIDSVQRQASAVPPSAGEIIHVFPGEYSLDEEEHIRNPKGRSGRRLGVEVQVVTARQNAMQNLGKMINRAGLNVAGYVLEPLASACSVLTDDERELGVALIDFGAGTADVAVFVNDSVRFTTSIDYAGNVITSDISRCLNVPISLSKAEEIKNLTPDADYARQTLTAVNTWNTNIIAKEMGMSAVTLNQHLQRLGIQYKQHKVWILSAKYQGKGYTKTQTYNYFNSAGEVCTRMQQEWTEVGRRWLLELWHQGKFSGSAV